MIGQTISHYRVLEKLGEGGMGVVYLAEDTRLGRRVALKALTPAFARDPQRRKRFQQEARAAATLTHPGIATVYELEEVGDDLYIVFEYVRGENLRAAVTGGGLDLNALLDIATDIAQALAAAHQHGIVHRDLKPENIIRTPEGGTKILDFGLARFQPAALDEETASHRLTDAGSIVGTVAYMSPQQLEGKEVDFRTDIFCFGVLLYELATGVRPFEGSSPASTISRILTAEAVPLIQRNPLTPPELDRIVRKCLRKRPDERYQSTRDLAVDLEQLRRDAGEVRQPVAPELELEEPSLLRQAFARFARSPRRWWELQQLFAVFVYAPIAFYLALKSSVTISFSLNTALASNWHGWQGMIQVIVSESRTPKAIWSNFGLAFFLTLILLLTTTVATRLYLVWLVVFIPVRLLTEVRRIHAVLRAIHTVVALQFMFAGFFLLRVTAGELILGAGLTGFGLFTLLAVSYAEPKMVRAAFPQVHEAPELVRPSLLQRAYTSVFPTPRRSWELNHLVYVLVDALLIYVGWLVKEVLDSVQPTWGLPLFFAVLLCAAASATLRLFLLVTSVSDPEGLPREVGRMEPWIRRASLIFTVVLLVGAGSVATTHALLAALLAGLAVIRVIASLVAQPAITRRAFPLNGPK